MRNTLRLFLPLLLLILLVAACGDTGNTTGDAGNQAGDPGMNLEETPMDPGLGEPLTGTDGTDVGEPLTGTEGTEPGGAGSEMMNEVNIVDFSYDPAMLTVAVGDTVTWTNNDDVPHTVTAGTPDSPTGEFDSGEIQPGETFSYTFDTAGTFDYYCTLHPDMMASVTVE